MSKLDPQIKALMRNTIKWEGFVGTDGFTDEIYTEPREIRCWIEEKGGFGGTQRNQSVGMTVEDPKVDVYMDAQEVDEKTLTLRDRWTYSIAGTTWTSQADRIAITYGPDGFSPWLIAVTL